MVPCDALMGNADQRPVWLLEKKKKSIEFSHRYCQQLVAGRDIRGPRGTVMDEYCFQILGAGWTAEGVWWLGLARFELERRTGKRQHV